MATFKLQYMGRDANGKPKEMSKEVDESVYRKAAENGQSLRQYLDETTTDADLSFGSPTTQMMATSGLSDMPGFNSPTMKEVDSGRAAAQAGFRSPDGNGDTNNLASRLLYPQAILETISSELRDDGSDIIGKYNEMVAVTRSVNSKKVDQPIINTTNPENSRSGEIAELAEPETLVTITTGDRSYRIPSHSIGLTISDEAMDATTIDLVNTVMNAQARRERIAMIEGQLRALVLGDKDRGIEALPVKYFQDFDGAITASGQVTKKAYIKWLREDYRFRTVSHVLTDLDTVLDLDNQLLPSQTGTDSSKIITPFTGMNLDLTPPKMVDFSQEIFGKGMMVGLDARNAIQRFINVSANYEAVERFAIRKANSFRVDYGEMATRLYDEAWSVVSTAQKP